MKNYIILILISVVLWEFTPLRKWFYFLKSIVLGKTIRLEMLFIHKIWKKYANVSRIVIDFLIFLFIFEWRNGFVINNIKLVWEKISILLFDVIKKIISILYILIPIGRKELSDEKFRFAFIVCTILVIIGTILINESYPNEKNFFYSKVEYYVRYMFFYCENSSILSLVGNNIGSFIQHSCVDNIIIYSCIY